jgi:hypothetical protein
MEKKLVTNKFELANGIIYGKKCIFIENTEGVVRLKKKGCPKRQPFI